ncbi:hypothetical protein C8R42DRAFT_409789 [Lentinula raphanica]|nr:hypothetical protein C8R42DRAFT_409789 [Lentinula raphanica]
MCSPLTVVLRILLGRLRCEFVFVRHCIENLMIPSFTRMCRTHVFPCIVCRACSMIMQDAAENATRRSARKYLGCFHGGFTTLVPSDLMKEWRYYEVPAFDTCWLHCVYLCGWVCAWRKSASWLDITLPCLQPHFLLKGYPI